MLAMVMTTLLIFFHGCWSVTLSIHHRLEYVSNCLLPSKQMISDVVQSAAYQNDPVCVCVCVCVCAYVPVFRSMCVCVCVCVCLSFGLAEEGFSNIHKLSLSTIFASYGNSRRCIQLKWHACIHTLHPCTYSPIHVRTHSPTPQAFAAAFEQLFGLDPHRALVCSYSHRAAAASAAANWCRYCYW